jgi:polysaccharide chain length determinant protein (PEP-CTERM system associated)
MNLDISYYVSVFFRRIYVMLIVAVGVTAAAIYVAMELPPTYRADARLLVESPQIPTNLAASTVQVGTSEQLEIIQQRLLTRENLLQIARQNQVFPDLSRMTADEIVEGMRQSTRISQSSGRSEATLMTVAFTSDNGRKAAAVVNEYVTRILEENRSVRTALAEQTLEFFEQEVERLSEELAARSARIVEFKRENSESLPTSLNFRQDRQTALQERINQIQRELALLDDQEERLQQVFESGGQFGEEAVSPDAQRLARLRADLDSALALYSPTNPRVRILEAQIKQVEDKILTSATSDADVAQEQDPRMAMLEVQIAEIEARRQNLIEQRDFIEQEVQTLSASIAKTPEVSVAIDSLEREYQNVRSQYDQVVNRLATAKTGERIELLSKGERITVIEQASVPNRPTSPNRPLIAGAGAVAGVGLGTALIFLLEFLNQSIRRPVDLERQLGVTPIATLPYIRTRREVIWKRLVIVALMAIVIIGGPALIYLVHTFFMPIDLILEKVINRALG